MGDGSFTEESLRNVVPQSLLALVNAIRSLCLPLPEVLLIAAPALLYSAVRHLVWYLASRATMSAGLREQCN